MPDTDRTAPELPVHVLFAAAFQEISPVGKEGHQSGTGGSFDYRQVDDVYDAVHDTLARHWLFFLPTVLERLEEKRTTSGGKVQNVVHLHVRYTFYGPKGDSIEASMWGEGSDSGDKATSKAATMAMKYGLIQCFCIPLGDMVDPDAETPPETRQPKVSRTQSPARPSAASATTTQEPEDDSITLGGSTADQWSGLSILAGKLGWDEDEKHRQAGVERSLKELSRPDAAELQRTWADMLTAKRVEERKAKAGRGQA